MIKSPHVAVVVAVVVVTNVEFTFLAQIAKLATHASAILRTTYTDHATIEADLNAMKAAMDEVHLAQSTEVLKKANQLVAVALNHAVNEANRLSAFEQGPQPRPKVSRHLN
jgi:hypothetical protein